MTDIEKRIKLAEEDGWHDWRGIESAEERVKAFGDVLPDYLNSLDAIQAFVRRQDTTFQHLFHTKLSEKTVKNGRLFYQLPPTDWCDCALAVLEERKKK